MNGEPLFGGHTSEVLARLPVSLAGLGELALDLRWNGEPDVERLFREIDPETWERAGDNPWLILQSVPKRRLLALANDAAFCARVQAADAARRARLAAPSLWGEGLPEGGGPCVAYFSAEVGIDESLPLYAGGLGILAGDHLKSCSDLGIPLVGVSLLYGQGFFRQQLTADGWQLERHPVTPVELLPLEVARRPDGGDLVVSVELPGRSLDLLVWRARVGRIPLLLLDANLPTNLPADRDITRELYADGREMRLQQELALGVGGQRALAAAGLHPEVLHLNEGHSALAVLEWTAQRMARTGCDHAAARLITAASTIFTTHTPVEAAFDRFEPGLAALYLRPYAAALGIEMETLLDLGRVHPGDGAEPFNIAVLAMRHAGACNGVSRVHAEVSRRLFRPWFPRIPDAEIPVRYVTNGVHTDSWTAPGMVPISAALRRGGTAAGGNAACSDEELWAARNAERQRLVTFVRTRAQTELAGRGADPAALAEASARLDPQIMTVGFARRFTAYKRPTLLWQDPERLRRLLLHRERPMQLVLAGKAHPADDEGKHLLQQVLRFAADPAVRHRIAFIEDDDISVTQRLVAGVDVWLNTPRPGLEASGTSGMKVLPNGGLNLSVPDGWWAEAAGPDVGWRIGEGATRSDAEDAATLYALLENEVAPLYYRHGPDGIPHDWLARVRHSVCSLVDRFSTQRMVSEYVADYYQPAARRHRALLAEGAEAATTLATWERLLRQNWQHVVIAEVRAAEVSGTYSFRAAVALGPIPIDWVQVQIFRDGVAGGAPAVAVMSAHPGPAEGCGHFVGEVPGDRPVEAYTVRVVPHHRDAIWPITLPLITWER